MDDMVQDTNQNNLLEERIAELENNWKRALADYKNLEKRVAEERDSLKDFANLVFVSRLLPVLDNLQMVEAHVSDDGLKYTVKEFKQILEDEGIKEINPKGEDFDATTMEAIETVEGEDGKVVEVLRNGYMLKNKSVRPARVKVGKKLQEVDPQGQ